VNRKLADAQANSRGTSSPAPWPKLSLFDLKLVDVEHHQRQLLVARRGLLGEGLSM